MKNYKNQKYGKYLKTETSLKVFFFHGIVIFFHEMNIVQKHER